MCITVKTLERKLAQDLNKTLFRSSLLLCGYAIVSHGNLRGLDCYHNYTVTPKPYNKFIFEILAEKLMID